MRKTLLLLFALTTFNESISQSDTSFWFAAPDLLSTYGEKPIYLRIASAGSRAEVKISIPANTGFTTLTEILNPGQIKVIDLSNFLDQLENTAVNTVGKKGLYISASTPITCYYDIANQLNGDLFVLKGNSALGNKFTVPFQRWLNASPDWTGSSDFIIVATENNTKVEITPKNDLVGYPKNTAFSINLNKGETYLCRGSSNSAINNPGGTIVKSDKPIAITVKEETLEYPPLICADAAGDQLIPDRLAGDEFIVVKGFFANGTNPDYYFVYATEDGTEVFINGASVGKIDAGEFYKGSLIDKSVTIKSSKVTHLLHVTGFGCEISMAVIPSIKCTGTNNVKFSKPARSTDRFYLMVIAPKGIINDFKLNGENTLIEGYLFEPVQGNSEWMFTRIPIHQTNIQADNVVTVDNNKGKFHTAIITGSTFETSGYGFFTDFGSNNLTLNNPTDPSEVLGNKKIICYKSNVTIAGTNADATKFNWTGPNGFSVDGKEISLLNFNTNQVGTYTLTSSSPGCKEVSKSIILEIDKPEVDFSLQTKGCAEEEMSFNTTTTNGIKWNWDFGNGNTLETANPELKGIIIGKSGNVDISVISSSALGCKSDPKIKSIFLSSKPVAAFTTSTATCINNDIVFTDGSTISNGTLLKWKWNLDDGNGFKEFTSNTSQSSKYGQLGKKDVRLVVESSTGCISDTFRINNGLIIYPKPRAGFIVPEVCLDDANAQFKDTSSISDGFTDFTYLWNFNAGQNPVSPGPTFSVANTKEKEPAIKYNKESDYKVTLIVNARGCLDSVTSTIRVNGVNPTPAFDFLNPDGLCSDDSVRIENKSSVPVFGDITKLEIFWDENDLSKKTVDEQPFPGKKYAFKYAEFNAPATKKYTIRLKVYSGNSAICSNSISKEAEIKAKPKLIFEPLAGICVNAASALITQAKNQPAIPGTFSFKGNGISTTGIFDPKIAGVGTHTITFVYATPNGVCKDSISNNVTVLPLPLASFDVSETACIKNSLTIKNNSTAATGSSIVKWIWNPNDGTGVQEKTNGASLLHTYTVANTYSPSLTVVSSQGCSSVPFSKPVSVKSLPVPGFKLPKVCLPDAKALFENQTTITDATPLTYKWDFGDPLNPQMSLVKDGIHTYRVLGAYNVKLIAVSVFGCSDSVIQRFSEIYPQPKAGFNSNDSACLGTPLAFEDTSKPINGVLSEWYWDLGDKTLTDKTKFTHQYTASGKYRVSLHAKTSFGCMSDTAYKNIEIFDFPEISAGSDLNVLDDGQKTIQSSAKGNNLKYRWSPSMFLNDTTLLSPIVVKPQQDMIYTFTVVGKGGCTSTDQVSIKVLKLPTPPNTFTPNGDGINDSWEIPYLDQYTSSILEIYTTTGQLIHRSVGYPKQWDGTSLGKPLPSGTYYYVIDPKNNRKKISGYVTIIR